MRHLACVLLCLLLWGNATAAVDSGRVSWIYDGDTLQIEGLGKVRLLGIDTPEKEESERDNFYRKRYHLSAGTLRKIAHQALAFNIDQAKNQHVRLEYDQEARDRYGRVLAYVYLPDGRMLNRLLLEEGLASVYRRFEFRFKRDFLATEEQARKRQKGLWAKGRDD